MGIKRRKARDERKEEVIRLRVTGEQRQIMQAAADAAGLDLSAWVRTLAYTTARRAVLAPARAIA